MNPSAPRRFELLGLGECMVELFAEGPLSTSPLLRRAYGGDVLNAPVTASRLGVRCGFISRVGDDPFGPALRQAWVDEGIDLSQAPLVPGDNGEYFISVSDDGEREFTYRRAGSAASQIGHDDIDEAQIASSHWLLLSGITQALSPSARAATRAAARLARQHGVQVAYDPNYRPRLRASQGGLPAARAALHELAPLTDRPLPSPPADAVLLIDAPPEGVPDILPAAHEPAGQLAALGPSVALKLGAAGCLIHSAGEGQHVPGVTAAHVLDSTGAGDLWNGSFIAGLLQGRGAVAAAQTAHRLAAAKLAHRGAIAPRSMYPLPAAEAQ